MQHITQILAAGIMFLALPEVDTRSETILKNDSNSIGISARPAKKEILLGEPAVIQVALTNRSQSKVKVGTELQIGVGAAYELSRDGTAFTTIAAGFYHDPVGYTFDLPGGAVFQHDEILLYDWRNNQPLFQEGTNYIRVRYYDKISNLAEVFVSKPEVSADILGKAILASPPVLKAIALKNVAQVSKKLNEVVKNDSVFSPYAAFFLAAYCGTKSSEDTKQLLDVADQSRFPLIAQTVLLKGETAFKCGEFTKAWVEFNRVRKDYKASAAYFILQENDKYSFSREDAERKEASQGTPRPEKSSKTIN